MQVRLVLRGYLILNRIQIFYLFKEAFSKALYIRFSAAPSFHNAPLHLPLFSPLDPMPKGFGHPPSPCLRGAWASPLLCWLLDLSCFIIKKRRAREEEKKKIKKKIKELIAIQTLFRFAGWLFLKKKDQHQRGLSQADPEWIPIETGYLHNLKKIYSLQDSDLKKEIMKQICDSITYLISA